MKKIKFALTGVLILIPLTRSAFAYEDCRRITCEIPGVFLFATDGKQVTRFFLDETYTGSTKIEAKKHLQARCQSKGAIVIEECRKTPEYDCELRDVAHDDHFTLGADNKVSHVSNLEERATQNSQFCRNFVEQNSSCE